MFSGIEYTENFPNYPMHYLFWTTQESVSNEEKNYDGVLQESASHEQCMIATNLYILAISSNKVDEHECQEIKGYCCVMLTWLDFGISRQEHIPFSKCA